MKAAAYLRVSKEEQAREGYSLEVQRKMAVEYAKNNNYTLDTALIFEEVMPASKVEQKNTDISLEDSLKLRPKLKALLDAVQKKEFNHLIILCRDRLARDFEQFLAIKFILSKNNITVHYSREGENFSSTDEKINRFLDNILANVAELESNVISSRVKSGTRLLVDKGLWPGGRAPLGYELIDKKTKCCKLKPIPEQASLVKEVFKYYKEGYSYKEIAQLMNEKYSITNWKKSKVEAILKNKTYTGHIYWDRRGGRRHPGKHETSVMSREFKKDLCYISTEEWDTIEQIRMTKVTLKDPKYLDTPFLLKDKLICGKCGNKMITKNYGSDKNGNERRVYKCTSTSHEDLKIIIPKDNIEKLVLEQLKMDFAVSNLDTQWDLYQNKISEHKSKIKEEIAKDSEFIEKIKKLRKNIQDIYKENLDEDLLERIEIQDELLVKTQEKYQHDLDKHKDVNNFKYLSSKEDFEKVILNLINNFFKLATTQRDKRRLITLVIDKIIVSDSRELINEIKINLYPLV